jgi:hypothetical protein
MVELSLQTLLGVLSGFVLVSSVVYYLLFYRARVSVLRERLDDWLTPDLLTGIFGPDTDVAVVDNYGERIAQASENTTRVDRLSGNTSTFDWFDERDTFANSDVENRILLLNPESTDETGELSGNQAILHSDHVDSKHTEEGNFSNHQYIYQKLRSDDWETTEVKVYNTTPWVRVVLFDGEGGFVMSPTLYDHSAATKFWTCDDKEVTTLRSVFEDVWTDPRTEPFRDWFERYYGDDA